ncbi:F-box protein CPR1-like [Papaver somniferum]|uniref:F-box protein CPR1-like n=1 Tax=Papaver somniferum TaxID=3469 RepID=UPI000E6F6C51|nr:F-box protein CPR1-like [Papaver somniferum]
MIRDANCWEGKDIFYIIDYDSISSASSSSCKCEAVVRLNYPVHTYTPILWNPSTREYNEIIPPPDNLEWPSYGFGYDNKIDDYKLVCIASIEDGADEVNAAYAYTLKSGSWRKVVETIPCADFENPAGLLLNGVLHWQLATVTGKISKSIVAFDISNEKFTNLPFPQEIILRPAHSSCHLGVLGASLCIICGVPNVQVDVWVMQNYGVKESWTKLFTTTQEKSIAYPKSLKLYWYFITGDILIQAAGRFGLYDQKNDRIRFLNINGLDHAPTYLSGETYVESLVSLNSGTYTRKRRQLKTKYISNKRRR